MNTTKFFKAMSRACSTDETRKCLMAIHKLPGAEEGKTRLCACNGYMIAIADVKDEDINLARAKKDIMEISHEGNTCYVDIKNTDKAEGFFPYVSVQKTVPKLYPIPTEIEYTKRLMSLKVQKIAADIIDTYEDREDKTDYFMPTHEGLSERHMQAYIKKGIFVGVMPLMPKVETSQYDIEELLPSFFINQKEGA
jgi:hypothetical protein